MMGLTSHDGRGDSSKVLFARSEGHVCSLRWVRVFHLGFGAFAIFVSSVMAFRRLSMPYSLSLGWQLLLLWL